MGECEGRWRWFGDNEGKILVLSGYTAPFKGFSFLFLSSLEFDRQAICRFCSLILIYPLPPKQGYLVSRCLESGLRGTLLALGHNLDEFRPVGREGNMSRKQLLLRLPEGPRAPLLALQSVMTGRFLDHVLVRSQESQNHLS